MNKPIIFKVEAMGDTLYIEGVSRGEAQERLHRFIGDVPPSMLTWTDDVQLPEGEELLA